MSDCKCKQPCGPCSNNCPDDGEIIESTILDPEDCNTNCCWKKCSDNCWINIQSTNDCLVVDTSECWVIKLTAECPKPTYVKAWNNITVRDVTPPSDCYVDWWDCDVKGWWEISSTDEKVKACDWDTTPWTLIDKLQPWTGINIDPVGCDGSNSKLKISIDESILPDCPEVPELVVNNQSSIIQTSQSGPHRHVLTITDKTKPIYDNVVCIWFESSIDSAVQMRDTWVADYPTFVWPVWEHWVWRWNMVTWNKNLASSNWIIIKQQWYYRLFWQLTVRNNSWNNRYINLWRWLLRVESERPWLSGDTFFLSTAKHWSYARHVFPIWWKGIKIDADWKFEVSRATVTTDGEWWTYEVVFDQWSGQPIWWHDWPWMTFNMDCYVDLWEWDIITLWYRCQSDMEEAKWKEVKYKFVWVWDPTTEYNSLFWWSCLWVQMITPYCFQKWIWNEVYERF